MRPFYGNQYVRKSTNMKTFLKLVLVLIVVAVLARVAYNNGKSSVKPVQVPYEVVTEVVKEIETKAPVLERIYKCESGGKHLGSNGQVILKANTNGSIDIGIAQINNTIWGKKASSLGLNLFIEEDNIKMAQYLYKNYGTEPWVWSKNCWNK